MKFTDYNLREEILAGLQDVRYSETTPIQEQCIPLVLEGKDVIGSAQTGTGKTGAFVIPLMEKILDSRTEHTQALILAPTRELARQIDEQIFAIGYHTGISSATVIGGSDFAEQARAIRAGVDIIVATPGRLLDQMNVLEIDFSHLEYLVLDECDRMLDMGFLPDVTKIVSQLPEKRQTLLFSATMPKEIQKVVRQIMKDPEKIEIEPSKPADSVDQLVYFIPQNKKIPLVQHLFDTMDWETAIIFTATKRGTDALEKSLKAKDLKVVSMHGDRSQEERNEALRHFKNKTYPIMVATDVLARGIDIDDISVIINYDVPNTPDDYIHRIGRTGRYDKSGMAITFVSNSDKKDYYEIRKAVGDQITLKDLPEFLDDGKKQKQRGSRGRKKEEKPPKEQTGQKDKKDKKEKEEQKEAEKQQRPKRQKQEGEQGREQEKKQKQQPEEKKKEKDKNRGQEQQQKPEEKKKPPKEETQEEKKRRPQRSGKKTGEKKPEPQEKKQEPEEEEQIKVKKKGDSLQAEIVEKAVSRNKYSRKPAKGIWGIIKSMIPKIRR